MIAADQFAEQANLYISIYCDIIIIIILPAKGVQYLQNKEKINAYLGVINEFDEFLALSMHTSVLDLLHSWHGDEVWYSIAVLMFWFSWIFSN